MKLEHRAGTLYGRNATGGLAHFVSVKPSQELEGYAKVTYGDYDQIKFEGDPYERTVVVEFNSLQDAQDAYNSEDYKIALKYSSTSSERHVVVVEGLE